MDYRAFIDRLPNLYTNWDKESVYPKFDRFQSILDRVPNRTTANVMQLLNFAVECMESGEIYCEIGCFQGATLIGALLDRPDRMAYAIDDFSRFDEHGENLARLADNLETFRLEEKVVFCEQDFEEFFWELKEADREEKIGAYFYNGTHDYRSQLMALLLVKPFLADRALIILNDSNYEAVQQASWDFMASHPQCKMLLDWSTSGNCVQVLSWDTDSQSSYDSITLHNVRKEELIQDIYQLQLSRERQILESIRQTALELHSQTVYKEAEEQYLQFLKWERHDFQIWYNLGLLYYTTEQYEKALRTLLEALQINESQAIVYYSLGLVYEQIDRLSEAIDAYQTAIAIDPTYIDAYNNLGNLLYRDAQFKQAESVYRQAISIEPKHYGSYLNLGNTLIAMANINEAVELYQAALALNPDRRELLENYQLFKEFQDDPKSFYHFYLKNIYSQVFKSRPNDVIEILYNGSHQYPQESEFHYYLIQTLITSGDTERASLQSDLALQLLPSSLTLKVQRLQLLPIIYQSQQEIEVYRQRYIQSLNDLTQQINLTTSQDKQEALDAVSRINNFYLAYQGENDLALQQKYGAFVHQVMAANYPEWVKSRPMPALTSQGKIRVGYISYQMGPYRLGELILGWLRHYDREKFEVYCYYLGDKVNDLTQEFQKYSDRFYQLTGNLESICDRVLADELHILVFIDIGLYAQATQLASLRLAPVQCTTWAHPVTSGCVNIDYFLSSELMEPGQGEEHYSEQLIRLPKIGISYPLPQLPQTSKTRADFGIGADRIVYLCCQVLFKYLPKNDYIFSEIARQAPRAQFVFICHPMPAVTERFKQRLKTAFDRVNLKSEDYCVIVPRLTDLDHTNLNLVSDIFLDSFEWSGGVTTLKAIACGLPVVTYPGQLMRGRHSYGILQALGITETIASNPEKYIDLAVKLGTDTDWYNQVVDRIKERKNNLYDDRSCIRGLEAFYQNLAPR